MPTALDASRDEVAHLARRFQENLPAYSAPVHKRAESRHNKLVALVERMLELHYRRQIGATDGEIDALVCELYAPTPEEIRIVEGTPTQSSP